MTTCKGYNITYDFEKEDWFTEEGESISTIHRCKHCGREVESFDSVDPCIGHIQGVDNACCGHGSETFAYVSFENGEVIRGREAVEWLKSNKISGVVYDK